MIYCSQMRQLSPFYDTVAAFMHVFSFLFRVGRNFFTCSFAVHLSIKYIFIFTENIFLKYYAWFIIYKEVIMKNNKSGKILNVLLGIIAFFAPGYALFSIISPPESRLKTDIIALRACFNPCLCFRSCRYDARLRFCRRGQTKSAVDI